jgi:hypothetical protein
MPLEFINNQIREYSDAEALFGAPTSDDESDETDQELFARFVGDLGGYVPPWERSRGYAPDVDPGDIVLPPDTPGVAATRPSYVGTAVHNVDPNDTLEVPAINWSDESKRQRLERLSQKDQDLLTRPRRCGEERRSAPSSIDGVDPDDILNPFGPQ